MSEGFIYEPRSFWSIENIDPNAAGFDPTQPTRRVMERRHFYNGQRWPIQINRLVICGVNPSMFQGDPAVGAQEGATAINSVRVGISMPQRFHLNARQFIVTAAIAPRPTWTPPFALPAYAAGVQASSLWGQSMLKFDQPLMLPRKGTIVWGLSAVSPWATAGQAEVQAEQPVATLAYQESSNDTDLWPGSVRSVHFPLELFNGQSLTNLGQRQTDERWPFLPDSSFAVGPLPAGTQNWWPPACVFNGQEFDRQESTRAGSTTLTDMRIHIDQRFADLELQGAFGTLLPPAPYSLRLGTRVITTNAGSKTEWWRPGAPVALVFDHITPANVYKLPEPITMGPGEQVVVELEFPPEGPAQEYPVTGFHIGVALNGFAAIEG